MRPIERDNSEDNCKNPELRSNIGRLLAANLRNFTASLADSERHQDEMQPPTAGRWATHQRDGRPIVKCIPHRPCSALSYRKFYLKRYSKRATELTLQVLPMQPRGYREDPQSPQVKLSPKSSSCDLCPTSLYCTLSR